MAAEFRACGAVADAPIERAADERPQWTARAYRAWLDAGVDILLTPTCRLAADCLADRIDRQDALGLARRHAERCRAAIADSTRREVRAYGVVGPVESLLVLEEARPQDLTDLYTELGLALRDGGVDGVLCRGFSELEAIRLAVAAIRSATGLPAIGAMSFDMGPERCESTLGVTPPQAYETLSAAGAEMIGCDAAEDPDDVTGAVALLSKCGATEIWAGISAGMAQWVDGAIVHPELPDGFSTRYETLVSAGASVIAGGGGVTAAHLSAMAAVRDRQVRK